MAIWEWDEPDESGKQKGRQVGHTEVIPAPVPSLLALLEEVAEKEGTNLEDQIDRAIRRYLFSEGSPLPDYANRKGVLDAS
jgi:hypothetical protein